jgi:glycosyltransferase 2 family protein
MKFINQNLKYIFLLLLFFFISYLSLVAVYHIASDQTSFLSLRIFSMDLFCKIIVLLLVYFAADVLRFFYVLKAINVTIPMKYMIRLAFVNIFVSNITPSATGGGVAQIYLLNKKGVSLGAATAGSSIRTALPIMFFTICTPIILIFDRNLRQVFPNQEFGIYVAVMIAFDLLIIWVVVGLTRRPERIVQIIVRIRVHFERKNVKKEGKIIKLLDKLIDETARFSEHFMMYIHGDKRYVLLSILFTLLFLFSLFLFPYFLIEDLNSNVSLFDVVFSQIVITAVMYFAPTPGAAGIAEAAFVAMFSKYVSHSDIVSLTFAWRLCTIYIGVIIGLVIFYVEIMKKHEKLEIYRKEE